MSAALTAEGTILGTFQYMAPEQLEGKDADARTDIFAFGALVYEMATGKKAFEGKSQASLIHAIMGVDPPPISTMLHASEREPSARSAGGGAPAPEKMWGPASIQMLDRVVKKCLAKEPDERWQSAKDLHDELKWVAEAGSQSATALGAAQGRSTAAAPFDAAQGRPAARHTVRERVAWVLMAIATAAAIALGVPYLRSAPSDVHPIRFSMSPPQNVTLGRGTGQIGAVVSPDGRRVAFIANRVGTAFLWVRSLDALEAQLLPSTENASLPFWSPDSRTLGFFTGGEAQDH